MPNHNYDVEEPVFFLEEPGIRHAFLPKSFKVITFLYEEFDTEIEFSTIGELRQEYRKLLNDGCVVFDPHEIPQYIKDSYVSSEEFNRLLSKNENPNYVSPDAWAEKK